MLSTEGRGERSSRAARRHVVPRVDRLRVSLSVRKSTPVVVEQQPLGRIAKAQVSAFRV